MAIITAVVGGVLVLVYYALNVLIVKPRLMREKLRKQGIDGPLPHFWFGNFPEIKMLKMEALQSQSQHKPSSSISHRWPTHIFPHLYKWRKEYGPIFLFYFENIPFLMIQDIQTVNELNLYTNLNLGKPSYLSKDFGPLLGQGIISTSGPLWAHQRKIIAPELYLNKVKGMVNLMLESTNIIVRKWEAIIESEEGMASEIRIDEDLRSLSADIISRACFGSNYVKGKEIFTKLRYLLKLMSKFNAGIIGLRYLPTKSNREIWRLEKEINTMISKLVKQRLFEGRELDLLQMILKGANKCNDYGSYGLISNPISHDKFIVDNCKNMFLAGHETTAMTASWALLLLAQHQDWQDRCRDEVLQVCGNGNLDAIVLQKMKTLNMVIQETLRLYPPAAMVLRSALQDIKLKDISLPKGMNIQIPISIVQQDPEQWGPDAHIFNPQRFANGILKACKNPQAFMPFGIGPHVCVGQHLAMIELKVILSLMLLKFQFSLSANYHHSPIFRLVIEPGKGVFLMMRRI